MSEEDLTSVPMERLEADITEYASHLAAAECWWLLRVAEFDRREGWKAWGCRSCAYWLSWKCGIDLRTAQEKLRVAHSLALLPRIRDEFGRGRLSYSKARSLTRMASPDTEEDLVEIALHGTAAHVEALAHGYRRVERAEERIGGAYIATRRGLEFRDDPDEPELALMMARLTTEESATVRRALDAVGENRSLVDALVLMAESFLANGAACRPGSDRTLVSINVDEEVLDGDDDGTAQLEGGPALAPATARRLACDASVVWVLRDRNGAPVDISTKQPTVPRALRRLVRIRDDGRCQFLGCVESRFTDVHHIHHREHGGTNELTNLVTLCWFHHRLVHEGGWSLTGTPGVDLAPARPDGTVIDTAVGAASSTDHHAVVEHNGAAGLGITPSTLLPQWGGERMDLGGAVSALWYRNHPDQLAA
jgi:hypothetical protein